MKKQVENMLDISEESASFINRATESYYKVNGEINKRVFEKDRKVRRFFRASRVWRRKRRYGYDYARVQRA